MSYPNTNLWGDVVQTSDGRDTAIDSTLGVVTDSSYGPTPVNAPPTTWDSNNA